MSGIGRRESGKVRTRHSLYYLFQTRNAVRQKNVDRMNKKTHGVEVGTTGAA